MDKLEQQIDRWMEHHLDDMVKYVMDLIRIPSIAQYEPQNRYPFLSSYALLRKYHPAIGGGSFLYQPLLSVPSREKASRRADDAVCHATAHQ